jgi:hypothetical protein
MLTAFYDAKGSIHREFVLKKQTVNGKFYKEAIKRLIARVQRFRLQFQESGSCTTMHRRLLRALSPRFWQNEGSPYYPIRPTPLI